MPSYRLRGVDEEVWFRVKRRAAREGVTLYQLFSKFLYEYAEGDQPLKAICKCPKGLCKCNHGGD